MIVTSKNQKISITNDVNGLGDIIASATKAIGIKPCSGCKKRQVALNRADRKVREIANNIKARILK